MHYCYCVPVSLPRLEVSASEIVLYEQKNVNKQWV
ncbi:protein of unknown function [Rhodovastum atsumiense]|nr:protein of unknown function [Rhodovastum atsumiense]